MEGGDKYLQVQPSAASKQLVDLEVFFLKAFRPKHWLLRKSAARGISFPPLHVASSSKSSSSLHPPPLSLCRRTKGLLQ
jgi:hypothetical protein